MTPPDPGTPPARRRAVTRRRTALGAGLALGLAAAVLIALSGSSAPPLYQPAGPALSLGGARSPAAPASRVCTGPAAAFAPSPAVRSAAAALSLPAQVAGVFVVGISDPTAPLAAELAGIPWGGVVLLGPGRAPAPLAGVLAGEAGAELRALGVAAPVIGVAQGGGGRNVISGLPPRGQSRVSTPALARADAAQAGAALRRLGFNLTLAPEADVDVPQGAFSGQLYPGDARQVARLAVAALAGYRQSGILAAAGHFPGQGSASADPDVSGATVGGSLAALRGSDLIPFAAAARAAPVMVMSNAAYAAFDGVTPASLLPGAVRLLRRGCGFPGAVMSGDLDAVLSGRTATEAALAALGAGEDLLLISGTPAERAGAVAGVLAAAERRPAVAAEVRRALLRVLALKAGLNGAPA